MSYGKVMEKLDYLRWYIGDTRIRNSEGYLINVNPYSENIYKSTIIYKIVNMFLYPDMSNEYERTKVDGECLPKIENIEAFLNMYDSLVELSKYVHGYNERLYRVDRESTVSFVKNNGYNPSNFSCSKTKKLGLFYSKSKNILLELNIKNAFIIDVAELLNTEYNMCKEREVMLLPFHNINIENDGSYTISFNKCILKEFAYLKIEDLKENICNDDNIENVNYIISTLNSEINNPVFEINVGRSKLNSYLNWKENIRRYVGKKIYDKFNEWN